MVICQYFQGNVKSGVRRRDAAIDGAVEQNLLNFILRDSVIQGSADVHTELVSPIESNQEGDCQQAARFWRKPGSAPYIAPRHAGDKVLKVGIKFGSRRHRPLDVLFPENCAANPGSLFASLLVIHEMAPCLEENPAMRR